jgi:hypothetical protein
MASQEERSLSMVRAGDVYGNLLAKLLAFETERKASIEQRGVAVITSSGVLVSLLIALSALLIGQRSEDHFGGVSRAIIIASVAAFIVAAIFGVVANAPRTYEGFSESDLDRIVSKYSWSANGEEAALLVAQQQARELKTAVKINNRKADYIQWAIIAQVIGVGLVAMAIIIASIL